MNKHYMLVVVIMFVVLFAFFHHAKGGTMLRITSSAFKNNENIPTIYTCKGEDISPALQWQMDVADAKSYLLILEDPDAQRVVGKTFVHWALLLPAEISSLPERFSSKQRGASKGIELKNDFGRTSYGGPCPPKGSGVHHYQFHLFALSKPIYDMQNELPKDPFTAEQYRQKASSSIIAHAQLIGLFAVE